MFDSVEHHEYSIRMRTAIGRSNALAFEKEFKSSLPSMGSVYGRKMQLENLIGTGPNATTRLTNNSDLDDAQRIFGNPFFLQCIEGRNCVQTYFIITFYLEVEMTQNFHHWKEKMLKKWFGSIFDF